ncbi:MAG: toll/interleukin-1 receptor domain-containing protein, partial [Acidobacteriota bacterium]
DVLRGLGYEVFLDQYVLKAGDALINTLEDALQSSQNGVLLYSRDTADSEWVRREYQALERLATRKDGFQFVPVQLDDFEPPLFAANRVYLSFADYPDGPNGGELLRLLYALAGHPLTPDAASFATEQDEEARSAAASIETAIDLGHPAKLVELFERSGPAWESSAVLGSKAAEGLIKLGENDTAIALLDGLGERFPRAIRPKQMRALALARRGREGDLLNAQMILGELYRRRERDPETVGILARTWMDRYKASGEAADLRKSRDLYAEAFAAAQDDYYTGINAAAKSVFLDDLEAAKTYAEQVEAIVGTEPKAGDYWFTATVGEVALIQGKYDDAARLYRAAVDMAHTQVASHRSTWGQAERLLQHLGASDDERAKVAAAFAHLDDG